MKNVVIIDVSDLDMRFVEIPTENLNKSNIAKLNIDSDSNCKSRFSLELHLVPELVQLI